MKCHSKWYVIIWLHVSEVHLEKSRGNGAKKSPARPVWSKAHQRLSASLPPSTTRDEEKKWPSGITDGEKQTKHTPLIKDTYFFGMYCTYRGIQYSRKALSLPLSKWWKGCSPRENKNRERDRCERGYKSLHQPCICRSDTPGIHRHIWRELSMGLIQYLE